MSVALDSVAEKPRRRFAPRTINAPASVSAPLTFTHRNREKLYTYAFEPPEGIPATNVRPDEQIVRIENARPYADSFSLDVEGFAFVRAPTDVRNFWDEAQTLALGHPEAAAIVKAATGAHRVVVFDHTLRKRSNDEDRTPGKPRQPAFRVHIDQTPWSGPQRVRDIMGAQSQTLLKKRAAIINVWRPINHTARDCPLALGDARSIPGSSLLPADLIFPHRRGETYLLAHDPAQKWFYAPDVGIDEAILIKCWDSDESVARFTPHSGFIDPTTPAGTPARESIEFRTIAFFD